MITNYIFIDYENVQPKSIELPDGYDFKVIIFTGAKQNKIPIKLTSSLQKLGDIVEYIQIGRSSKNALDFHITFYIGRFYEKDPKGYFHIISKDKGYDSLIEHLREKSVLIKRSDKIEDIPILNHSNNQHISFEDRVDIVIEYLKKRANAKPLKYKTLFNTINASIFHRKLNEEEINRIIENLKNRYFIVTDLNDKLRYSCDIDDRVELVINALSKRGKSKPKKYETLFKTIDKSIYNLSLSDDEVHQIIDRLSQKNFIKIDNGVISYLINENIDLAVDFLKRRVNARPSTYQALLNTLNSSVFHRDLDEIEIENIIDMMFDYRYIATDNSGRIVYHLD